MSISFSGLGSGLDYSSWIDELVEIKLQSVTTWQTQQTNLSNKQSTLNSVKSTFNTLRTSLETVADSKYGGSLDVFSSNSATSSDSKYVTATVTNNATRQDLSVFVEQLASNTVATSTKSAGKDLSEDTLFSNLANGSATSGTFSLYVDNQRHEISIEDDDTLGDIKSKLEEIEGIHVSFDDNKMTLSSDEKNISVGANVDSSNFATVMGLTTYDSETKSYTSSHEITELRDSVKLLDENSGFSDELTAGTFKIGNATFTIDENTTLKSLINKINTSSEAGVKASYDYSTGKLSLLSNTTGSMNINIEAGTSNFTDIFGFTNDGKLDESSQTVGNNAKFSVNGTEFVSFSNTATSDVTGLTGVTLNLNAVNKEDDDATTVSIVQNTDKIYNLVSQFVNDLNSVITQIDTNTATDEDSAGVLAYESQLISLRNSLRTSALQGQKLSDGSYQSLASIGITTGEIGTDVDTDTSQLVIDEDKLREAISTNPDMVKELLLGNDSLGTTGAVNSMLTKVTGALDSTNGYFATKSNSISTQIDLLDEKIENKQSEAEKYRENLETQFQAMDTAISKLSQQYSSIDFDSL